MLALASLTAADAATLRWSSQGDYLTADPMAQNELLTNSINGHVYESLVMRGKKLEIRVMAEDPDTFVEPWQGVRSYDLINGDREEIEEGHLGMAEVICQEGNRVAIDYGTPVAEKPDF